MPNPLVICMNLLPIGTYLSVLGLFHALGRPLVTTGVRDFLALTMALAGLVITGPIDYVLHYRMLPDFLVHSHWIGLGLYLVLVGAMWPRSHERLIVYNALEASVSEAVRTVLQRNSISHQEVAGGWILPERGVSLEVVSFAALRNVTLHFHGMPDRGLFKQMQDGLIAVMSATGSCWSLAGSGLAVAGGLVLAFPVWVLARDPGGVAAAIRQVIDTW